MPNLPSPSRKSILIAAALAGLAMLVAGLTAIASGWNRPMGPGLGLPTTTASVAPPEVTAAGDGVVRSTPAASATASPAPLCGGPSGLVLLGIGADNREDNYLYGLADAIRVARVDFVTPAISVLSLPRDVWVEIPEISDHYGITHGKLNQAYFYGNPGMGYYDGPGAGPGLLARTLDLNFGLRADHYGAINMQTFVRLVDAVGGIDLVLPAPVDGRPVDDKTEDMGYFAAGPHHMNGETALRYSRIRKVDTVFARDDRQTQVLCALKEKLLSPEVIGDIPQIIAAFQGSVLTDLSPAQVGQIACLAPFLKPENLRFASLPEEWLQPARNQEGSFIWQVDPEQVRSLVADFLAGAWPTEPDTPSCP